MMIILKEALIFLATFLTGVFIFLGVAPSAVVAPDVTPPTALPQATTTASTSLNDSVGEVATSASEEQPNPLKSVTTTPPEPEPLIENYEESLQEALEALARLQSEQVVTTPTTPFGLNETVRDAVVNVLCTTAGAGPLSPISASGVIIDSRGIVLTNAHVAQYFLLEDYPTPDFVECVLRTGSPASPTYTVDLLFLPPSWITNNAQKIDDEHPTGNGEHDYALLRITGVLTGRENVVSTYLPLLQTAPAQGESVLLASYPAGFLGGITIAKELYAASAEARVEKIYTFDASSADLFSIGGSVVAQQGSSGGAVAQSEPTSPTGAALTGLIVTSSDAPDTASRDLRALSTEYIIRDFEKERGVPLATYLARNLADEQRIFEVTTFPTLSAALISVLEQ